MYNRDGEQIESAAGTLTIGSSKGERSGRKGSSLFLGATCSLLFVVATLFVGLTGYFLLEDEIADIQRGYKVVPESQPVINNPKVNDSNVELGTAKSDWYDGREFQNDTLTYFSAEELAMFGVVKLPEGFEVQDDYRNIKFVRSPKKEFSEQQLALMRMFIDRTPDKLRSPGPAAIVIFEKGEIDLGIIPAGFAVAFASGPYIFLDDNSFDQQGILVDDSIDQVYSTFEHELVHTMQFNEITKRISYDQIVGYLEKGQSWNDVIQESSLVAGFAAVTGWEINDEVSRIDYDLNNREDEITSDYGKTKITEDMADTVAGIILTKYHEFSEERVAWTLETLGYASLPPLEQEKLPYPEEAEQVQYWGSPPKFSEDKMDEYETGFSMIDVQYFSSEIIDSYEGLKSYYARELDKRGWKMLNEKAIVLDHGEKKTIYEYESPFRNVYIEILTYDSAYGYVTKPEGTIITVLSGYKL